MKRFPYLRPIYPDELAHTYMLSIARDNLITNADLCQNILKLRNGKLSHIEYRYDSLYYLCNFIALTGSTDPFEFFRKATIYNAIYPFIDHKIRSTTIGFCLSDFKLRQKIWSTFNHNFIKELKICPLCQKEEEEKYGEYYYHRSHQLDRVKVCHKHGTPLSIVRENGNGLKLTEIEIKENLEKEKEIAEFFYLLLNLEDNEELKDKWLKKLDDYIFFYNIALETWMNLPNSISYSATFPVEDIMENIIFYLKNGHYPSDPIKKVKRKDYEIIEDLGDNIYRCRCLICGKEFISTKDILSVPYTCTCARERKPDEKVIKDIFKQGYNKRFKFLYLHAIKKSYFLLLYDKEYRHILLVKPSTLFYGQVDTIMGASAVKGNGHRKRLVNADTLKNLPFTISIEDNRIHIFCKKCGQTTTTRLGERYILSCPHCEDTET